MLSEIFPVSANVFGDAAIDAMGSAYEVLAMSSINIEKHQEFEAKLVNGSYFLLSNNNLSRVALFDLGNRNVDGQTKWPNYVVKKECF